jgi:hypothetical protein
MIGTLAPDTLATFYRYTEGWLLGIHMLGLVLQDQPDPAALLSALETSTRPIIDFLTEVEQLLLQARAQYMNSQPLVARETLDEALRLSIAEGASGSILAARSKLHSLITSLPPGTQRDKPGYCRPISRRPQHYQKPLITDLW